MRNLVEVRVGWKSLKQDKIVSRFIRTRCSKSKESLQEALKVYFKELNEISEKLKPSCYYNMDEVALFFELSRNQALELKGKNSVGKLSSGSDKQRMTLMIAVCSNGSLMPPFIILKCSKPKDKIYKDHPANEIPTFSEETQSY